MIRRLIVAALFSCGAIATAQAAIPASERQVLLNLFSSAGGANWIHNSGWLAAGGSGSGAAGTECGSATTNPWYGVQCDTAQAHVIGIYLVQNNLIGALPSLAGLTQLQTFNVANNNACGSSSDTHCSLGGELPALNVLSQLQSFSVDGNGFTGSIPPLVGLANLQGIDLANNRLTGAIPPLDGLTSLEGFNVAGNNLSGAIPSLSSLSSLQMFDVDNNGLSGSIPALSGLTRLQSFYAFANELSGPIPALSGLTSLQYFNLNSNQLSGPIPALTGLGALQNFAVDGNQLSGSIPSLSGLLALNLLDVGNNQLGGSIPAAPSLSLVSGQSILCANKLTATPDPDWDMATGVTPWYSACGLTATTVNLDQFGLSGTWYNALTSGQGFQLGVYPDALGKGPAQIFLAWYTFSPISSVVSFPNWYTLQGESDSSNASAILSIYAPASSAAPPSGVFNAPPKIGSLAVGTAVLSFSDCTHGTLLYQFYPGIAGFHNTPDIAAGLSGAIPLTRLTANTTCGQSGDNGESSSDTLLSGAWFDPATSGQGLVFDVNPSQNLFSAGWYTFPPSGASAITTAPWYTLQTTSFVPGSKAATASIFASAGGFFDNPAQTKSAAVGTATVTFQSCSAATLVYDFTSGLNQGLTGTINLQRIGPVPAGCSL